MFVFPLHSLSLSPSLTSPSLLVSSPLSFLHLSSSLCLSSSSFVLLPSLLPLCFYCLHFSLFSFLSTLPLSPFFTSLCLYLLSIFPPFSSFSCVLEFSLLYFLPSLFPLCVSSPFSPSSLYISILSLFSLQSFPSFTSLLSLQFFLPSLLSPAIVFSLALPSFPALPGLPISRVISFTSSFLLSLFFLYFFSHLILPPLPVTVSIGGCFLSTVPAFTFSSCLSFLSTPSFFPLFPSSRHCFRQRSCLFSPLSFLSSPLCPYNLPYLTQPTLLSLHPFPPVLSSLLSAYLLSFMMLSLTLFPFHFFTMSVSLLH